MLLGVEIGSCNSRKLSRSIEDFGFHDEIALMVSIQIFNVFFFLIVIRA